jgi:hypothetical protein
VDVPLEAEVLRIKLAIDEARDAAGDLELMVIAAHKLPRIDLRLISVACQLERGATFRAGEKVNECGFQATSCGTLASNR